jgi:hypothetical protein
MDYLEGFLIGPVWSDTDYKSHRHFNAHLFLAFLMAFAFAGIVFYPLRFSKWIIVGWPASLIILIGLTLITPFLSSFYYRLPVFLRPLVLFLYAFKFVLLFYVLTHYFLPLATLDSQAIPMMLLDRLDRHINHMVDIIADTGGIFRTVLGIVAGTIWIVGEGLLLMVTVITIPLAAIGVLKGVQYVLDRIVNYVLYQPINEGVPVRIFERPSDTDVFDPFIRTPATQNVSPDREVVESSPKTSLLRKKSVVLMAKIKKRETHSSLLSMLNLSTLKNRLRTSRIEDPSVEEEDVMHLPEFEDLMEAPESDDWINTVDFNEEMLEPESDDWMQSSDFVGEMTEPEAGGLVHPLNIEELLTTSETDDGVYPADYDEQMATLEPESLICPPEPDEQIAVEEPDNSVRVPEP